ncbi:MAG: hypothetical protein R3E01_33110 [Pirellulaceae bacterium]
MLTATLFPRDGHRQGREVCADFAINQPEDATQWIATLQLLRDAMALEVDCEVSFSEVQNALGGVTRWVESVKLTK